MANNIKNTRKLVLMGILTALVVVLQFVSMYIRTGLFSITLSLVPIVVGAALYGKWNGAWLGGVLGVAILLTGDANPFLAISIPGTIITVMGKGILSGFMVGVVYEVLKEKNDTLATYVSGILAPIFNTGIFILGCYLFFFKAIKEWAGGGNSLKYIIVTFVSYNFLIEFAYSLILSPSIAKIIKLGRRDRV